MNGLRLKEFRTYHLALTQHQFAYIFGHSVITIYRWESGTVPKYWADMFEYIWLNGRSLCVENVLLQHGRIEALLYLLGAPFLKTSLGSELSAGTVDKRLVVK